jgi:membrane protease YdiL (CAAX protease family)
MDYLKWKLAFVVLVMLGWTVYVLYSVRKNPSILKHWGFRLDNSSEVLRIILPFAITAFALFIGIGMLQETIHISWHIIPVLLLYPLWGTIQQFLVVGLVAGNLHDLKTSVSRRVIIFITAMLFGLVHYPDKWLMIGTFILALFYCYVYLRSRNVFLLGLFHGWLGALFYYTVVDRDPFLEVFGKFL